MGLSIIIPTHNRRKNLLKSVKQLLDIRTNFDVELIVVNDVISDDLRSILPEGIIYLLNKKGGVAASRNLGAEKAAYDNLLFIDDDMLVDEAAVVRAFDFLNSHKNAVLNLDWIYPPELIETCDSTKFGRFLIHADQVSLKGWMAEGSWKEKQFYVTDSMASPFLAIAKVDFDEIGGYNEVFPYSGFEDYDFSKRTVANNTAIWLDTNFTIFHNEEENTVRKNWLNRRFKNSYTRGIAVSKLNNEEMQLDYSKSKRLIFGLIYFFRTLYAGLLFLIPNHRLFDRPYRFFLVPLIGAHLMKGYQKGLDKTD